LLAASLRFAGASSSLGSAAGGFLLGRPNRGLLLALGRFGRILKLGCRRFVGLLLRGGGTLLRSLRCGALPLFGSRPRSSTSRSVTARVSFWSSIALSRLAFSSSSACPWFWVAVASSRAAWRSASLR
jgi:hypothetical protein